MPKLDYARFFEEQIETRRLKVSQIARDISEKYEVEYDVERAYEFLKGRYRPLADEAAAWQEYFGVTLGPRYFGFGVPFKASAKISVKTK